jgi:hypothetical protein
MRRLRFENENETDTAAANDAGDDDAAADDDDDDTDDDDDDDVFVVDATVLSAPACSRKRLTASAAVGTCSA